VKETDQIAEEIYKQRQIDKIARDKFLRETPAIIDSTKNFMLDVQTAAQYFEDLSLVPRITVRPVQEHAMQ
jgi:hypothetical protein